MLVPRKRLQCPTNDFVVLPDTCVCHLKQMFWVISVSDACNVLSGFSLDTNKSRFTMDVGGLKGSNHNMMVSSVASKICSLVNGCRSWSC